MRVKSLLFTGVPVVLGLGCIAGANQPMPEDYRELQAIVSAQDLSKEAKIWKLRWRLSGEPAAKLVSWVRQVDPTASEALALETFRKKETSRRDRLELGRMLLCQYKTTGFIDEYAPFLVGAVLDGEAEFMAVRTEGSASAVGDYALIAAGFNGMNAVDFAKVADPRVVPVLIKALDAPDTVYGEQVDCCDHGKVGDSTGRNSERQWVAVALARLGASEATGALKRAALTRSSYWDCYNAAYAVARLGDAKDAAEVEAFLKGHEADKDYRLCLFAVGKGLVGKGDGHGIQFLGMHYWPDESGEISSLVYYAKEPLAVMKDVKDAESAAFYGELLDSPGLRALFLFDPMRVKVPQGLRRATKDLKNTEAVMTSRQALDMFRPRIIEIYQQVLDGVVKNHLTALSGKIHELAENSTDDEVRRMSASAVEALARE